MKKKYICNFCGKEFIRHSCQIKSEKVYCSLDCLHSSNRTKISDEIIHDLYFNQKLSKYGIQKKLGISYGVVYNVFQRNEWKFRSRSEAGKFSHILNLDKTKLIDLYINQKKTIHQIAEYFNCSDTAVKNNLNRYKIKKRTKSEALKGKNNPNWQGGITKIGYSYQFNQELREQIRKRDHYKCQNCGMTEEEHLIVRGRVLDVHHIDYNKQNCKEDNLIAVCNWCNTRANFNRDYWYAFYKYIINEKYSEVR